MRYRFHGFELDVRQRELRRGRRRIPLQPKVFELLRILVLHRQRAVPKEALLRDLWPDSTVTTASLTRLVKEARRTVGDSGRRQQVIQTSQGYGYRFVAEVVAEDGDAASESEQAIELARRSLEASLELGARDLRAQVREFAETCLVAVHTATRGGRPA